MRFLTIFMLLTAVLTSRTHARPTILNPADFSGPVITCPGDTVLQTGPFTCDVTFDYTVTASDDLPGWSLTQTQGLPSGAAFPIGSTVNTYLVTDVDGNTAACTFTVTVVDDVPPNVAVIDYTQIFIPPYDDVDDCYDGYVTYLDASVFNDGSYDNCSSNLKFTIRRAAPYSAFILSLNPVNGHPDCNDLFPDAQSEFERAISEGEQIKFYCGEAGTEQILIIRAYQLDSNGDIDLDENGNPIYTEALSVLAAIDPSIICQEPDTSAQLVGSIQLDADGDCAPDVETLGLPNMIVEAKTSDGATFYTLTGTGGSYNLSNLPQGLTEVTVKPYLPIWNICNNQASVSLPAAPSATQLDFNALPVLNCPLLIVDIAADMVQPCATQVWHVSYSNKGNVTAENATVQITGKAPFVLVDANKPFSIAGEIMTIQIGNLKPGESGEAEVRIQVPCDAGLVGQNVCVEASIAPVSTCLPTSSEWLGAQIEASAVCSGDSIRFTLKNTGAAATSQTLDFFIIDDMVVMHQGQIPAGFPENGVIEYTAFSQGHPLRIQSEQERGHPLAQKPSLLLGNCAGSTLNTNLLQFHNEDGNPFTDQECRQIVNGNNVSQILAFPTGLGNDHLIEAGTRVTYQVNFENNSNEDVHVVVLQNNIPAPLNPADIRMGAGSHPYTWSLSGTGILEIRFEPIALPAGANGFVQFDVAQKEGNPVGTVIENEATVYFDINPSFKTNKVWHTIGENFLTTSNVWQVPAVKPLIIYPNPASKQVVVQLEETVPVQIRLVNMLGQKVMEITGKAPGVTIDRGQIPSGVYQIEVQSDGQWIKSGKLIWE